VTLARLGILVLYGAAVFVVQRFIARRLDMDAKWASRQVLLWVALPTLWFLPGLLWIGLLPLPFPYLAFLSLVWPASVVVLAFTLVAGPAFVRRVGSQEDRILLLLLVVVALVAIGLAPGLYRVPPVKLLLFCLHLGIPPVVLVILLWLWAPTVVPLRNGSRRLAQQALSVLLGVVGGCSQGIWAVEQGHLKDRVVDDPVDGMGPGLVLTEPETVVVLQRGSQLARVDGPGVVLMSQGEIPHRVVCLRDHRRTEKVRTVTRDGIEVALPLTVRFRVHRAHRLVRLGAPWPYRSAGDVMHVLLSEEVDLTMDSMEERRTVASWEELPIKIAAHKLEQVIPLYSMEQLLGGISGLQSGGLDDDAREQLLAVHRRAEAALDLLPARDLGDPLTRSTVEKLIHRAVSKVLEARGFQIIDVAIDGRIEPVNREVIVRQVEAWKSRFIERVMADTALSEPGSQGIAETEEGADACGRFAAELADRLMDSAREAGQGESRSWVASRLLTSLIELAQQPDVGDFLPEHTVSFLEDLHATLVSRQGEGGEGQ